MNLKKLFMDNILHPMGVELNQAGMFNFARNISNFTASAVKHNFQVVPTRYTLHNTQFHVIYSVIKAKGF